MTEENLIPRNRKADYHKLGKEEKELSETEAVGLHDKIARALAMVRVVNSRQGILQYNLNEYKAKRFSGEKEFKMRDIEKEFDDGWK